MTLNKNRQNNCNNLTSPLSHTLAVPGSEEDDSDTTQSGSDA